MISLLIVFLFVVAIINLGIGYVLGSYRLIGHLPAWGEEEPAAEAPSEQEIMRSGEFIRRLQELARNIHEITGRHSNRMGEITAALDLPEGETPDPADVLAAATAIIKANQQLESELANTKLEIEEQQRQLETTSIAARTDVLTGILNRRAYDEEFADRFRAFQRQGSPLCLLVIDVDHFKKFNDEHGHLAGDAVLRGVACELSRAVRNTDIVARYGGEEFCALLPGTGLNEAKQVAERLRQAIENAQFEFESTHLRVTVSVGLATAGEADDPDALLKRADSALYDAKRNGRNCSYYHNGTAILPIQLPSGERQPQFSSIQRVAPFVGGRMPSFSRFREVHCEDLSQSGFSFLTVQRPNYDQLAVAFGTQEEPFYRVADVKSCVEVGSGSDAMFRVGCVFADQVQEPETTEEQPAAPALAAALAGAPVAVESTAQPV